MPDRKIIFDAVRVLRGGQPFNLADVHVLDVAIDQFLGTTSIVATPHPQVQIGLSESDFTQAAIELGCTVAQIRAVDEVESGGGWFTNVRADILGLDGPGGFLDGPNLPKILFEAQHFDRLTGGKYRTTNPNISSKAWNRALYVGGQGEYVRLNQAMKLDRDAALKSASVGRYQIMGFNHKLAGYATVGLFWDAMKRSETDQLIAFVNFITNSGLQEELRKISNVHADCVPFARAYNGPAFQKNEYQVKLAKAHKKWSGT